MNAPIFFRLSLGHKGAFRKNHDNLSFVGEYRPPVFAVIFQVDGIPIFFPAEHYFDPQQPFGVQAKRYTLNHVSRFPTVAASDGEVRR